MSLHLFWVVFLFVYVSNFSNITISLHSLVSLRFLPHFHLSFVLQHVENICPSNNCLPLFQFLTCWLWRVLSVSALCMLDYYNPNFILRMKTQMYRDKTGKIMSLKRCLERHLYNVLNCTVILLLILLLYVHFSFLLKCVYLLNVQRISCDVKSDWIKITEQHIVYCGV